jgi:hypothetical protein
MSFYGQQQQAAAQSRMAQYNFAVANQQAALQNRVSQYEAEAAQQMANYQGQFAQYQSELAYRQAALQGQAAQSQYQAQLNNAAQYDQQALRVEQEARERASRMRQENQRLMGAQRARYGKSGVTSEGSPLAVMAETAGLLELGVADELYKANLERSAFFRRGEVARFEAGFSLLDKAASEYEMAAARFRGSYDTQVAKFQADAGRFQSFAAQQGYGIALQQASANKFGSMATASGARLASYGSLLEGVGNTANLGFNYGTFRVGGSR